MMMKMKSIFRVAAPIVVLVNGVACASDGGSEDAGHEEEDPAEEACEHMADGPAASHTATLAAPYPNVNAEHTRHDVTLVDDAGQLRGTVVYEVGEATDYLVFFDKDIPVAFFDSLGVEIAAEGSEAVTLCDEVAVQKTVELGVGSVELRFGPTSETTVSVVIEEAGGHEDHED